MTDPALQAFIAAQTRPESPALVPEIRLHLATEVTPLWQATEAALDRHGLPPPYWAFAWPGGQALARYVLNQPGLVRGKRVLDFAAGGGIAGLAVAKAGGHVTCAEIDRVAATAMAMNAALNGLALTVAERDVTAEDGDWAVVLAGDVFYERPMAERVEPWLRRLAGAGSAVLVGDPGRAYLPKTGLREVARYTVPTSRELEDREFRETVIYRLEA